MVVPSEAFEKNPLYIDYPQETVAFRTFKTANERVVYRKFYKEEEIIIPFSSELFFDARRYGVEISEEEYSKL